MSMSIKAFVAGAVGVLACAGTAWGRGDCNGNQIEDPVELATGRAFDDNNDGVIDECEQNLPRIWSLFVESGGGCGWDTETPGCCAWDLFVARSIGGWINDDSIGRAEIGLRVGVNDFRTAHSAPYCGANLLTIFLDVKGFPRTQLRIAGGQATQTVNIGFWIVKLSNYSWSERPVQSNEWSAHSHEADGYPDINGSFRVEVAIDSAFDCNSNGIVDAVEIQQQPSRDCNNNGRIDTCESGFTDCNSNSLPDSCDIASGTSADADSNGVPDSCQPDCNLNNLPDAWEIATGRATDYNADGIPDTCQGAVMVDSTTDNLGAPSGLATREHVFAALPFAESAVNVVIDLVGDLNRVNEYVEVSLNGGVPRRFFEADGNDCPATPDRAVITLTRAEFNALISSYGAGGSLRVSMIGSPGVDSSECKNAGMTQFRLQYVGIQEKSGDCNGNHRLDIAETHDGTTPDCNANMVPDSCDIARGAAQDCNANAVPDACELASTPALDCNRNGVIDSCDVATGGTSVDCDQNGRIDSCQVTETPGTDCNGNLRPDACDIAAGTSGDIDHNGTPDECQTVTVPGQYAGIQAAIDAAPANVMRIISVSAGTYAGPIAFNGKPVIVRGAGAASTVIAGNGAQQLSVVRFSGGEPAIAALERVTVRGGTTGSPIPNSPTVLVGGGIFGIDSAASVRDCMVEQNAGGFGGGAYFLRCSGEVRGTTIRNNSASSDGGGFQQNQGSQRLTDVVIEGNTCNSRGGGMHLVQGNPTLTRVTVRNNYSNNLIGGVSWYALGSATATAALDACAVTGNSALVTQGGIGISAPTTGTPTISLRGTNVCNNTPRPNITGRWSDLGGNTVCDCAGDLNIDGVVNGADLGLMLSSWGPCGQNCNSDLNGDNVVNGADLGLVLSAWGACGG